MSENPYATAGHAGDESRQTKPPRPWGTVLAVLAIGTLLTFLLLPATRTAREAGRRNTCANNLKQIALALRNYEATYRALPPAYTVDADGKPLHSWRTLILPFLDLEQLYKLIDLSKPWDGPANAAPFKTQIAVYQCPSHPSSPNHTTYLAVVASNGCFRPVEARRLSDITDSHAETLMIVEVRAEQSVHWMSPMDADERLVIGDGLSYRSIHTGGLNAAFVDGSVRYLGPELPAEQRRAMVSIAGHDVVADDYK